MSIVSMDPLSYGAQLTQPDLSLGIEPLISTAFFIILVLFNQIWVAIMYRSTIPKIYVSISIIGARENLYPNKLLRSS